MEDKLGAVWHSVKLFTGEAMNLVKFYRGEGTDDRGRRLHDYWVFDYQQLEEFHDYIQQMFPLVEPSFFYARAPTFDDATLAHFRRDPVIRENLLKSLEVMLDFYGFALDRAGPSVTPAAHFRERAGDWMVPGDHNHLRITRILNCLMLCGLEEYAQAFHGVLLKTVQPEHATETTLGYWENAVRG
jgi:hypothetical protein